MSFAEIQYFGSSPSRDLKPEKCHTRRRSSTSVSFPKTPFRISINGVFEKTPFAIPFAKSLPQWIQPLNIIIPIPEYWGQLYDSDWIVKPQKYYNDTRSQRHINERPIIRPSTNCSESWEIWYAGYETNLVSPKIALIPNIWHSLPNFGGLFCGINLLVVSRQIWLVCIVSNAIMRID